MRFLYVKLEGYIGLYNGLGLSEIELDFTRCRNKITVISGPNGVGKSTLLGALNILPDNNSCFVPTMNARKIIKLFDEGNIYDIVINHPLDRNNNRATTKATIAKNGLELNSNGNISSYKDIIFTEFDMDANYMSLSKISGDNRGIADKKPADRKKIMSSLIGSLEVYNNIYKNLNKKANIFKSYINTLTSKIQNVGDENNLKSSLMSFECKERRLNLEIEDCKKTIISAETMIKINDPDGSMKEKFEKVCNDLKLCEKKRDDAYLSLSKAKDKITVETDIEKEIESKEKEKEFHLNLINTAKLKLQMIAGEITKLNTEIEKIEEKKSKISSEDSLIELEERISSLQNSINTIDTSIKSVGINSIDDISKDEVDHIIEISRLIVEMIDDIYSNSFVNVLSNLPEIYFSNINIPFELEKLNKELMEEKEKLVDLNLNYTRFNDDKEIISILSNRPKNCKNDSCPFIANALKVSKKYNKDIEKQSNEFIKSINKLNENIQLLENQIKSYEESTLILSKIGRLMDTINSNKKLLSKFSISAGIVDEKALIERISKQSSFNELKSLSVLTDISNDITEYKQYNKMLVELQNRYIVCKNNKAILQEYDESVNKFLEERENLEKEIETQNKNIEVENMLCNNIDSVIRIYKEYQEAYNEWNSYSEQCKDIEKQKQFMEKTFDSTFEYFKTIENMNRRINELSAELSPISGEKKNIETQLTLLNSYMLEYNEYKMKYDLVDKLRKYSSPTSGSIQSLFMSIYMDKTLSTVNQLLGMMFNGQYRILDYVINEDEFRIPFVGSGLIVDDISNGSTSQVCIMGMVINLVLADISSGKYNIVSLDEIDGGLDQYNRYMFVDVLQKICDILNIEQLFIISHSVEASLNNVDVILLSNDEEYRDRFVSANVIYQVGN